uniref:Diacylglycerol kinase type I N-terminal domain-containing protein n=1 Tax=Paramormyrops kingsleyae TaxID=1676925 RepID=A0A3B3S5N0_9TELE
MNNSLSAQLFRPSASGHTSRLVSLRSTISHQSCLPDSCPQPIDYEGFQLFMKTYLENDIPQELCQHLFTSFKSKTGQGSPAGPHNSLGLLGKCPMAFPSPIYKTFAPCVRPPLSLT